MSIEAVAWAFKQDVHPAAKKFVLVALADNADQHGICFPAYTHIEQKTSLSRRAVIAHIQALVEEGFLSKAPRLRGNASQTSNAYLIPIPSAGLTDHPLISLFEEGGANSAPPLGCKSCTPEGANSAPPITINNNQKEKKDALSRSDFLREIDKGFQGGEFSAFDHLTESEVQFAAQACWDHWAAKGQWPAGAPVPILRNWIRGGLAQGKIRKREQPRSGAGDKPRLSASEQADQIHRLNLQAWVQRGFWLPQFGPAPDENGCKVPTHIMNEFFPDGKIPANA